MADMYGYITTIIMGSGYHMSVFKKRLKYYITAILLSFILLPGVFGQKNREEPLPGAFGQKSIEDTPPLKERLFYGGNFGLQFGSITDIQVSPVVGIWLLPRLNVAVGPNYRYYRDIFSQD